MMCVEDNNYYIYVIVNAIIEQQKQGQICPKTIEELKKIIETKEEKK